MPFFTDQTGRNVMIPSYPQRILSLVPSQTEFLFDLGLEKEVAGITKFCVHPDSWHRTKPRVGGTKQLNMEAIHHLRPDFILANKEENSKEQVEELAAVYPVWVSDIKTPEEAYNMMNAVGTITGKQSAAAEIISSIRQSLASLSFTKRYSAVYFIWDQPCYVAGGDTFISQMMYLAGFDNLFINTPRYPELRPEASSRLQPDLVILSSEPYPFKEKHRDKFQQLFPAAKIILADGEMFSWYGSRMRKAAAYFQELHRLL